MRNLSNLYVDGVVGIGTTSPSQKLHVVGSTLLTGGTFAYLVDHGSGSGGVGLQLKTTGANAPFVQWHDGTNILAGIRATSAKDLHLQTDGYNTRIIAKADGNVGIGTTSPQAVGAAWTTLEVQGKSTGGGGIIYTANNGASVKSHFYSDGTGGYIGTQTNHFFGFTTNNAEVARFTAGGNLGIGTNTPDAKLHAKGSGNGTYILRGMSSAGTDLGGLYQSGTGDAEIYLKTSAVATNVRLSSNGSSYLNGGNVGIGTTSPAEKLHVEGSIGIKRIGVAATSTIDMQGNFNFDAQSGYSHVFKQAGSEVVRILSSGNVGIGTSTPSSKLHSKGEIRVDFNNTDGSTYVTGYGIEFERGTNYLRPRGADGTQTLHLGSADDSLDWNNINFKTSSHSQFRVAGSDIMRINSTGVGIGTTSPGYKLHVVGNVKLDGTTYLAYPQVQDDGRLRFGDDNDYSIGYNSSDDTLRIADGNSLTTTPRITLNSSGNVGIGTTSPAQKLEVSFASSVYGARFTRNDAAGSSLIEFANNTGVKNIIGYNAGFDGYTIGTTSATNLIVKPNGNVGIGTTSPAYKLDVIGNARIGQNSNSSTAASLQLTSGGSGYDSFIDFGYYNTFDAGIWHVGRKGSTGAFFISDYTSGSELNRLTINSSGNVGVGTTSPSGQLTVYTSAYNLLNVSYPGTYITKLTIGANAFIQQDAGNEVLTIDQGYGGGDIAFNAGGSVERMRITDGGNVGIGTDSPTQRLDVNGKIRARSWFTGADDTNTLWSSTALGTYLQAAAFTGTGSVISFRRTDTSVRMVIDTESGNVGIGTTSPSANLEVAGAVKVTDSVSGISIGGVGHASLRLNRISTSYDNNILFNTNGDIKFRIWQDGSSDYLYIRDEDNATNMVTFQKGGNVGIGTASPSVPLHVIGNTLITGRLDFTNANVHVQRNVNELQLGAYSGWRFYDMQGISTRMFLTQAGNLGIGTTSPAAKLHVDDGIIRVTGTTSATGQIDASPNFGAFRFYDGTTFRGGLGMGIWAGAGANTDIVQYLSSGVNYHISNTTSPVLTVSSGGNVGIGTTSPAYKLHVDGGTLGVKKAQNSTAFTDPFLKLFPTSTTNTTGLTSITLGTSPVDNYGVSLNGWRYGTDGTPKFVLKMHNNSASGTDALTVDHFGNVGIGTTSPSHKLHIVGGNIFGSSNVLAANNVYAAGPNGFVFGSSTSEGEYIYRSGNDIRVYANGGDRLTILGTGNVGIGTNSPGQKLHVVGDARIEGNLTINGTVTQIDTNTSTTEQWLVTNDGTGPAVIINQTGSQPIINIQDDGTSAFYIEDGGNVGLGTTNPDARLDVIPLNYKVIKLGNDITSHYTFSGQTNHTLTLTSPSYYQAEVVITAHQTNSGGYNNLYIRGIWSNNHTSHHWDVLEEVGYLTGSTFTITNGQNDVENSGKLEIVHNYNQAGSSFSLLTVRVTDMYGTHSYAIS